MSLATARRFLLYTLAALAPAGALAAPLPPGAGFEQHVTAQGFAGLAGIVFDQGSARYDPALVNSASVEVPESGLAAFASASEGAAAFFVKGGYDGCPTGVGGSRTCPFSTAYRADVTIVLKDVLTLSGVDEGQSFLRLHFSGKVQGSPFEGDRFNLAYGGAGARIQLFVRSPSGSSFDLTRELDSLGLSSPRAGCLPSIDCLFTIDITEDHPLRWTGDGATWSVLAQIRGYATGTWVADFLNTAALAVHAGPSVNFASASGSFPVTAVPEPSTVLSMLLGLALVGMSLRRRRMASASTD
jgi:hypothetical protein